MDSDGIVVRSIVKLQDRVPMSLVKHLKHSQPLAHLQEKNFPNFTRVIQHY